MKTVLACCALVVLFNGHCYKSSKDVVYAPNRPNIIFLLADDMRYDALGYAGNKIAITPSLDKLATAGSYFSNAYVTSAICCISRASILTGQYAKKHGITDFDKNLSTDALLQTYPGILRHEGYYTGFIGKYGVGTDLPATFFDFWKGYPGHGVYFYKDSSGQLIHETALMGKQARQFLEKRDKSKPFCLSISFKAPHSEDGVTESNGFRWDPYFNNWYSNITFPFPETYDDTYYLRFPLPWRKNGANVENEGRVRWKERFAPDKFQTSYHAIYRLVSGVDKVVGELRDYLKDNGLESNTIIVFNSDNGFYMGEHGLEGKWYGHEESVRVPLIIYDPRLPQQRRIVDEIALNVDLAPTFLTWANVAVPTQMQGKPLQRLLSGSPLNWRHDFFYEHPYQGGTTSYIPKTVGLISTSWKYMRYYNGSNSTKDVVYEELYDVATDSHEKNNRINDPEQKNRLDTYKKKVSQYERELRGW